MMPDVSVSVMFRDGRAYADRTVILRVDATAAPSATWAGTVADRPSCIADFAAWRALRPQWCGFALPRNKRPRYRRARLGRAR